VPGPVRNTEQVTAQIGPTGTPTAVTDLQTLVITRQGTYIVRELGPARRADGLGDTVPPVLELGQVVWQGFSPGTRTLRALLTLDPGIEANRLPMSVAITFRDTSGRPRLLGPGEVAPTAGTATVTLTNQTASPRVVPIGTAAPRALGAALQTLYDAARRPAAAVPPYAGHGLPSILPGTAGGEEQISVTAPLHVTGTLTVPEAAASPVNGPGTAPTANGARLNGTLDGSAAFTVALAPGQHLHLDLDVRPWLDPRLVTPPARDWAAALAHAPAAELTMATTQATELAASAARAAEYSPYLQADTPGSDLSSFHYLSAPPPAHAHLAATMTAKPGAITAAWLAVIAIAANAALLWRQL
jgi:hypothetical protein